jgi:MoaA/NifB/PqqE/SkfB family radical SAM enzyme
MHIETTSRCTLACPACPRTWFSDKFGQPVPKKDLDLDALIQFLDCEAGNQISEFSLNGNHGDSIYYPRLFDLIEHYHGKKQFRISTNGSHQKESFWNRLAEVLGPSDTILFGIDGLQHNNHLYRRNSDWDSIMMAIDIMSKTKVHLIWKTLIFSYNEKEIDQIRSLAESKGMTFVADVTSRFGDQSLMPSDPRLILADRLYSTAKEEITELEPRCSSQQYISAEGYYWPCCMISSYYTLQKTWLWKEREKWSIHNQTLDQAQQQLAQVENFVKNNPKDADTVCKMHCKKNQFEYSWPTI